MTAIDAVRRSEALDRAFGYGHAVDALRELPSAQPEQPSREYVEQLRWERDLAIQQLKDLGYGLGEKPRTQPEIIRCKDCKNWDTTWQNDWAKNYHYCPLIDGTRNGDWYCADAERRTE